MKATFRQDTVEEHIARMKRGGLPDHAAVAATELSQSIVLEDKASGDRSFIDGKNVSTTLQSSRVRDADWEKFVPEGYKFKSWKEYVREEDWSEML